MIIICGDMFSNLRHVETVVSLSHKNPDTHININVVFGEGGGKIPMNKIAQQAEDSRYNKKAT